MSDVCTLHRGTAPLLVSLPHDGTALPPELAARMTEAARGVPDTDWHVARGCTHSRANFGARSLVPAHSRLRDRPHRLPDDTFLYPGQNTTGSVPMRRFTGPGSAGRAVRQWCRTRRTYWRPYHSALRGELDRIRAATVAVLLWKEHSIGAAACCSCSRSCLPDLNPAPPPARVGSPELQAHRRCCPRNRVTTGRERPVSGGTSPATTAILRSASTRCSWRSASATTWTRIRSNTTRRRRRSCNRCCARTAAGRAGLIRPPASPGRPFCSSQALRSPARFFASSIVHQRLRFHAPSSIGQLQPAGSVSGWMVDSAQLLRGSSRPGP